MVAGVVAVHRRRRRRSARRPRPRRADAVKAGGTLKVGWEQSFGFTDNFDPTGEYLGDAFGHLHEPARPDARRLQRTSPAPPGTRSSRTSRPSVPKPTNGGKTYTFHLKPGIKFSPPVNRAVTSRGLRDRARAAREPEGRRPVRVLLHRDQGLGRLRRGQGEVDLGHLDAERVDDRLQPDRSRPATSSTGWRCRRRARMPAEVTKCFEGQPGQVRPRPRSRPAGYMFKGIDQVDISSLRGDQAGERLRRPDDDRPRPQPELQPGDGPEPPEELRRTRSQFIVDASATTSTTRSRPAQLDTATVEHPAAGAAQVRDRPEPQAVLPSELGRPHLVPDDEPDAGAVRRHPRPQGDELDHGQARAPCRRGAARRSATIANHIVPDTLFNNQLAEYDAVQDARRPRQRREGEGRDEGLEVRHERQRHVQRQPRARTCC